MPPPVLTPAAPRGTMKVPCGSNCRSSSTRLAARRPLPCVGHGRRSSGHLLRDLTVANGEGSDTTTRTGFAVSASPTTRSVVIGGATDYAVVIEPKGAFAGAVTLSVSGLPAGANASFSRNPVDVSTETSSTLFVSTRTTTRQGRYTLTVTGTSGLLTRTTTVELVVKRK